MLSKLTGHLDTATMPNGDRHLLTCHIILYHFTGTVPKANKKQNDADISFFILVDFHRACTNHSQTITHKSN